MNRRQFLRNLAILGVASHELDIERLLWVPNHKTIFVPTLAQINLLKSTTPLSLHGIPYHCHDGFTGEWLGFKRDE